MPGTCQESCPGKRLWRLTAREHAIYSVEMDAELDSLDAKIAQLVQLCQRLRKDNSDLHQELGVVRAENRQLSDRIEAARARLEALLENIPEEMQ